MQVHHGAGVVSGLIERPMHEYFLRRLVAADVLEISIKFRQAVGVDPAQTRIGRRHQIPVRQTHADITRAANRKAARKQAGREFAQQYPSVTFVHLNASNARNAFRKKSVAPKLPDFSASSRSAPPPV